MSQNDMTIANQGFPATRADINSALQALASTSSGATEPSTMFANQLWFDTTANKLKIRNEANSAWYDIVGINESTGALTLNSATIGATTAAAGAFTTLSATGVTTVQAGTAALPAITTTGDTNTGVFFPAADTIAFAEGGAEAMRIDSSGNVGIGTTSPAAKLHVSGYVLTGSQYYSGRFSDAINSTYSIAHQAGLTNLITDTAMAFYTSNTERMRIDTSGNLQLGTTSNNGRITSLVNAAGRAGFFMVNAASSLSSDAVGISKFDNNTTTSQVFVKFFIDNNAAASGLITANGANQATFTSSSDARLKENIVELPSQLANIMALRPVEFDYIESEGGGHQIGFIAQEVQEVYPDVVGIREDGMFLVSDMNKNDARLIKAIQEQQAMITALTTRITALEVTP